MLCQPISQRAVSGVRTEKSCTRGRRPKQLPHNWAGGTFHCWFDVQSISGAEPAISKSNDEQQSLVLGRVVWSATVQQPSVKQQATIWWADDRHCALGLSMRSSKVTHLGHVNSDSATFVRTWNDPGISWPAEMSILPCSVTSPYICCGRWRKAGRGSSGQTNLPRPGSVMSLR